MYIYTHIYIKSLRIYICTQSYEAKKFTNITDDRINIITFSSSFFFSPSGENWKSKSALCVRHRFVSISILTVSSTRLWWRFTVGKTRASELLFKNNTSKASENGRSSSRREKRSRGWRSSFFIFFFC